MAGLIPQSFINDLLQRIDIVDLIDSRVKLTKAGKSYKACCPFHQEKTPSFIVNPERGGYKCFGCGAGGTAISFLMDHDRMEFVEAVEALAAIAHVEVPREGGGRIEKPDTGLYELLDKAAKLYCQALRDHPEAIDYLKGRGLDGRTAARYRIGFVPPGWDYLKTRLDAEPDRMVAAGLVARNDAGRTYDRFRHRIMFPIRDSRGRVVAFGGRLLSDAGDGPKYLNSPETSVFHKARELYGLYEARHSAQRGSGLDRLIVVEGYMDVVALAQNGIRNAVATLGTAVGTEHFERLYRNTSEVVCCFDGDRAGRQAAWRALEASLPSLRDGRQCKFVFLPEGEDPDSLVRSKGREHLEDLIAASKPAGDYLVESLSEGLDLTSMDARARLCELARPFVSRIPRGVLRRLLVDRLARIAELDPDAIDPPSADIEQRRLEEPPLPDPGPAPAARTTGLDRRLLRCLLQEPSLFGKLDASLVRALLDETDDDSLFLRVARWAAEDGDADASVLLARFVHEPFYNELRDLADTERMLDADALEAEFVGGVRHYLGECERRRRLALVDSIRNAPTKENIARYLNASRASRNRIDDADIERRRRQNG
ncbi:MAG: DNA primase [Gammaproteobacteria bacterium]|nr:DNA primase [Gammaproteobacteria bacterium]